MQKEVEYTIRDKLPRRQLRKTSMSFVASVVYKLPRRQLRNNGLSVLALSNDKLPRRQLRN